MFFAFTGIVSGFWHVTWVAGVGVLVASALALAVHSAGYTKLMSRRAAREAAAGESDGPDGPIGPVGPVGPAGTADPER